MATEPRWAVDGGDAYDTFLRGYAAGEHAATSWLAARERELLEHWELLDRYPGVRAGLHRAGFASPQERGVSAAIRADVRKARDLLRSAGTDPTGEQKAKIRSSVTAVASRIRNGRLRYEDVREIRRVYPKAPAAWLQTGNSALEARRHRGLTPSAGVDDRAFVRNVEFAVGRFLIELDRALEDGFVDESLLDQLPGLEWARPEGLRPIRRPIAWRLEALDRHLGGKSRPIGLFDTVPLDDGSIFDVGQWVACCSDARLFGVLDRRTERELAKRGIEWSEQRHTVRRTLFALDQFRATRGPKAPLRSGHVEILPDGTRVDVYRALRSTRQFGLLPGEEPAFRARGFQRVHLEAPSPRQRVILDAIDQHLASGGGPHIPMGTDPVTLPDGTIVPLDRRIEFLRHRHTTGDLDQYVAWELRRRGVYVDYAEDRFQEGLRALDAFIGREGHALVPTDHAVNLSDGSRLGLWVQVMRRRHNSNNLPTRWYGALKWRGFVFDVPEYRFRAGLFELADHVARGGDPNSPPADRRIVYVDGSSSSFADWVYKQREQLRHGSLPPERQEALTALGVEPSRRRKMGQRSSSTLAR